MHRLSIRFVAPAATCCRVSRQRRLRHTSELEAGVHTQCGYRLQSFLIGRGGCETRTRCNGKSRSEAHIRAERSLQRARCSEPQTVRTDISRHKPFHVTCPLATSSTCGISEPVDPATKAGQPAQRDPIRAQMSIPPNHEAVTYHPIRYCS